jgi:aminopeptidase-like protein
MKYGIKYCILESNFGDLLRKIREFKREFQQDEIILEIMTFIKASMDKKPNYRKIEYDLNELKIQNLIMNFTTINEMIENIDKNMIHDEDISNFKNQFYNYIGVKNMEKELMEMDINWMIYKQSDSRPNKELYNFVKKWFIL